MLRVRSPKASASPDASGNAMIDAPLSAQRVAPERLTPARNP